MSTNVERETSVRDDSHLLADLVLRRLTGAVVADDGELEGVRRARQLHAGADPGRGVAMAKTRTRWR